MSRSWVVASFICLLLSCAEDELPEDHFPCGVNGGSCEIGSEVCVVVDGCSACEPAPTGCEGCDCIETASDVEPVVESCYANGSCSVDGGGVSLTCEVSEPMLGCG